MQNKRSKSSYNTLCLLRMSGKNAYQDEELKKLQEQYYASGREKRAVRRSAPEPLALPGMIFYYRETIFQKYLRCSWRYFLRVSRGSYNQKVLSDPILSFINYYASNNILL